MNDHVYKVIEIVGTSSDGIEAAVKNAVDRASQTLKGLDWFEVRETRGAIRDGEIAWYQVKLGIGFRLMEESEIEDDDD